uniref:Uncharacterized protein n=1 Tax=Pantoea phage Survivor TaxID=3232176 RepID=A0AAU8L0Y8_9CAUD
MITQILKALKGSLAQCKKHEDPAQYIYALNSTLNRYKSNLFNMIPNKELLAYDPKELFNFRIHSTWRLRPDYKRESTIADRGPIMLSISGFIPLVGERRNLEKTHNQSIRIDDVIDLDRIANLKTDYYKGLSVGTNSDFKDEEKHLEEILGWEKLDECSVYYSIERAVDDVINVAFQLNSKVYSEVLDKHHEASAARMADSPLTKREIKRAEARARLLVSQPELQAKYDEVRQDQQNKHLSLIDNYFGSAAINDKPLSAATLKKGEVQRVRKPNAGLTKNKRGLW